MALSAERSRVQRQDVPLDPGAYRRDATDWLARHRAEFEPVFGQTLAEEVARARRLQGSLFASGLFRAGWPESVGGAGGTPLLRAILAEELAGSGLLTGTAAAVFSFVEILAPAFLAFASEPTAAQFVPSFLAGRESWCQGFSEPDAGSDLGALRTSATFDGKAFVLRGQKVWTSLAQFADQGVILARTGTPEDRHRGISAFLVDMTWPGVVVRPIRTMGDVEDFCELFLDDVEVPAERLLGRLNEGWAFTMHVLACERGAVFWQRAAWLQRRLVDLVADAGARPGDDARVGDAFLRIYGLRARSRRTQLLMAGGDLPGAEASLDKILMTTAEQTLFDLARDLLGGELELSDDPLAARWREEYLYSRAASIYGGTAEIQRNMVASHLLDLPRAG